MSLDKIKNIIKEVTQKSFLLAKPPLLVEMTFNRAKKHIEEEAVEFVMISAYRGGKGNPGNRVRHKEMKSAFRDAGFPFVDMVGGYSEEESGDVTEPSLLVLGHSRPDFKGDRTEGMFKLAAQLAQKYDQDSFIYGTPTKTATGDFAMKEDPMTGELRPIMDIRAYDKKGNVINQPWAGPWNSLTVAKDDSVYWSVVGGKKAKLTEVLKRYEKFIPLKKEHAMRKEHYIRSSKAGLLFWAKRQNERE